MELPYCSQPEGADSTDTANNFRSLTVPISTGGRNERYFNTLSDFIKYSTIEKLIRLLPIDDTVYFVKYIRVDSFKVSIQLVSPASGD